MSDIFDTLKNQKKYKDEVHYIRQGEKALRDDLFNEGIIIAKLAVPGSEPRYIKVTPEEFMKHMFVVGGSGSGKTSFITSIFALNIEYLVESYWKYHETNSEKWKRIKDAFPGAMFIDPFGNAAVAIASILNKYKAKNQLPKEIEDLFYYFHFGKTIFNDEPKWLPQLNILDIKKGDNLGDVIDDVIEILSAVQSLDNAPRALETLSETLKVLMLDNIKNGQHHNIFTVSIFMRSADFRNEIIERLSPTDADGNYDIFAEDSRMYWKYSSDEKDLRESIATIDRRISVLRTDPCLRLMFGGKTFDLDFARMMDQGHIALFDISAFARNRKMQMMMYTIFLKTYNAAQRQRKKRSKTFIKAADEYKKISELSIIPEEFAELRQFGIGLIAATQFLAQLPRDVQDAIKYNTKFKIFGRLTSQEAKMAAEMLDNEIDVSKIKSLPSRTFYIKADHEENNRTETHTFIVQADPPYVYGKDGVPADHNSDALLNQAKRFTVDWVNQIHGDEYASVHDIRGFIQEQNKNYAQFLAIAAAEKQKKKSKSVEVIDEVPNDFLELHTDF